MESEGQERLILTMRTAGFLSQSGLRTRITYIFSEEI